MASPPMHLLGGGAPPPPCSGCDAAAVNLPSVQFVVGVLFFSGEAVYADDRLAADWAGRCSCSDCSPSPSPRWRAPAPGALWAQRVAVREPNRPRQCCAWTGSVHARPVGLTLAGYYLTAISLAARLIESLIVLLAIALLHGLGYVRWSWSSGSAALRSSGGTSAARKARWRTTTTRRRVPNSARRANPSPPASTCRRAPPAARSDPARPGSVFVRVWSDVVRPLVLPGNINRVDDQRDGGTAAGA